MAQSTDRIIRASFWDSPDTLRTSALGRLLYIGMWSMSDSWGIGEADPQVFKFFLFRNDDMSEDDIIELMLEVEETYGVVYYVYKNRALYYIPSWDSYQKFRNRGTPRYKKPDELENVQKPTLFHNVEHKYRTSTALVQHQYGTSAAEKKRRELESELEGEGEKNSNYMVTEININCWKPNQRHVTTHVNLGITKTLTSLVEQFRATAIRQNRHYKSIDRAFTAYLKEAKRLEDKVQEEHRQASQEGDAA